MQIYWLKTLIITNNFFNSPRFNCRDEKIAIDKFNILLYDYYI